MWFASAISSSTWFATPNKIPQVREYYKKTSWGLAMRMRSEHTFESGVDKILQSPDKHDALARWPVSPLGSGFLQVRG